MARPVKGDDSIDDLGKDEVKHIKEFYTHKNIKNFNTKITRDLIYEIDIARAKLVRGLNVKTTQSQGGLKGNKANK